MSRDKLCVALDGMTPKESIDLLTQVEAHIGWAKVGMELFTTMGPEIIWKIQAAKMRVFLDLKYHDIPNTVGKAVGRACKMGVDLLNVHAAGGSAMLQAASKAAYKTDTKVIAVTLLTSLSEYELEFELGVPVASQVYVARMANLARDSGLDGVVCSPLEAADMRSLWSKAFIATPGIRLPDQSQDDQKRVSGPKEAIDFGSSLLVLGRVITQAYSPSQVAEKILGDGELKILPEYGE